MNDCLTTPQHEKQIGYWVSEKGKCMNSESWGRMSGSLKSDSTKNVLEVHTDHIKWKSEENGEWCPRRQLDDDINNSNVQQQIQDGGAWNKSFTYLMNSITSYLCLFHIFNEFHY